MSYKHQTLGEFIIENQSSFKYSSGELSRLIPLGWLRKWLIMKLIKRGW